MKMFEEILKMAKTRIISGFNKRQLNRYNTLIFLVILIQISACQCYSQVRRSGSTASVDELKNVVTQKISISPMLKPSKLTIESKNDRHTSKAYIKNIDRLEHRTSDIDLIKRNESSRVNSSIFDEIAEAIDLVEGDILPSPARDKKINKLEKELLNYVDDTFSKDNYVFFDGVKIEPVTSMIGMNVNVTGNGSPRSLDDSYSDEDDDESKESNEFDVSVMNKFKKYAKTHMMSVNLPEAARFFGFKLPQGKSSFLTGFGLGFLAFGLKKLLLPLFLGAQIVKSVLIAMFLPSILGSIGKIVGKGLSQFSGSSINLQPQGQAEDVDYKDNMGYPSDQDGTYTYPNGDTIGTLPANSLYGTNNIGNNEDLANVAMSRFGPGGAKVTYLPNISDNYYKNGQKKQEDFKVFRNIPASSLLLSNYDPFYSPLLSRLDSVFQRLGLGDRSERCRERLVCLMYASPAKYAPYSNLVSAQLSRELNELRKPTSDNPEILRFFKYMRAAKEGQEGIDCAKSHPQCPGLTAESGSAAMLTTYNDINKLVSARKL